MQLEKYHKTKFIHNQNNIKVIHLSMKRIDKEDKLRTSLSQLAIQERHNCTFSFSKTG